MKKHLIIMLIILAIIVSGCFNINNEPPNQMVGFEGDNYAIAKDGTRICIVAETSILFEDGVFETGRGYVVRHDNRFGLGVNTTTRWIFPPVDRIGLCNEVRNDNYVCERVFANITLPCSYCVKITKNLTAIDENMDCLSREDMYYAGLWKGRIEKRVFR